MKLLWTFIKQADVLGSMNTHFHWIIIDNLEIKNKAKLYQKSLCPIASIYIIQL